jgi:hypothetical protein
MKISKFVKLGALALLATSLCFVGCEVEDDDDSEGAISGSNKNYSINYTNSSSDIYRCWNTTTFKHLGEVVKIQVNSQTSSSKDGNMGFVWDLCQSKDAINNNSKTLGHKDSGYQNFFVVGLQWNAGTPRYYISKYFNVTNLQAENFGAARTVSSHDAGIQATDPVEIAVVGWKNLTASDFALDTSGSFTAYVDIYPVYTNSTYGCNKTAHTSDEAGSFVVEIYNADPTATNANLTPKATKTIDPNVTGYTAKPAQNTLAVYANVQPSKTLKGTWYLAKDYAEAETVEE